MVRTRQTFCNLPYLSDSRAAVSPLYVDSGVWQLLASFLNGRANSQGRPLLITNQFPGRAPTKAGPFACKRVSVQRWLILGVLFLPVTVFAMDFFRFCLFSDVEGRVVLNGKPVAGAVVERRYSLDAEKYQTDTTKSDEHGYFRFGKVWKYSLLTFLPGELDVYQEIWIKHGEVKYEAWRLTKHRPLEVDSELPPRGTGDDYDGKSFDSFATYPKRKIKILCDLADEPTWKERYLSGSRRLFGICKVVESI